MDGDSYSGFADREQNSWFHQSRKGPTFWWMNDEFRMLLSHQYSQLFYFYFLGFITIFLYQTWDRQAFVVLFWLSVVLTLELAYTIEVIFAQPHSRCWIMNTEFKTIKFCRTLYIILGDLFPLLDVSVRLSWSNFRSPATPWKIHTFPCFNCDLLKSQSLRNGCLGLFSLIDFWHFWSLI